MSDDKPWLQGGAQTEEERRAAKLLTAAVEDERRALARLSPRRIGNALARRLEEGEWPQRRSPPTVVWASLAVAVVLGLGLVVFRPQPDLAVERGSVWVDAQRRDVGVPLAARGEFVTRSDSCTLTLSVGATLELSADSAGHWEANQTFVLEKGQARFRVQPRSRGQAPFAALVGDVRVEVVGTVFDLARTADEARVWVSEGTVRVKSAAGEALVHAGESWTSSPRRGRADQFDQAATALSEGRVADARRLYETLAATSDPSAETALYLLARLEGREGQPVRALSVLDELLQRFPAGQLGREAQLSRIEALAALKRCDDARRALQDFRSRYPGDVDEPALSESGCQ